MTIVIDSEFKALIPPLQAEEFAQLEANILADGCRDPLVVWPMPTHDFVWEDSGEVVLLRYEDRIYDEVIGAHEQGEGFHYWKIPDSEETFFEDEWPVVLIDGHNRHAICTKHGLEFSLVEQSFESKAHARVWMRNNQKGRRNLPRAWLLENELGNKDDLAEIGAVKRVESKIGNQNASKNNVVINDNVELERHNTREEIAKAVGVSTGLVAQAEIIRSKAPELWEKAKAQEITIGAAYKEIKNEEKKQERAELIQKQRDDIETGAVVMPVGVFEVVAIDPPWNYGREYDPESSRVANPYP